jgi:hypothetical protein
VNHPPVVILIALLFGLVGRAEPQAITPACLDHDDGYERCALQAAGIAALSDVRLDRGDRELRFWVTGGFGVPYGVVQLQVTRDTARGRVLLVWPERSIDDSFAQELCTTERWISPIASLCVARLVNSPNWNHVVRQLDGLGVAQLPSSPVPDAPCPPPIHKGGRMIIRGCSVNDGLTYTLELRTSLTYWRYTFSQRPDPNAAGFHRDASIVRAIQCAYEQPGGRACKMKGAP